MGGIKMFGVKRLIEKISKESKIEKNPVKYARELGVNISDDCRIIDWPNWGSEPYLISIGEHVTISYGCCFINHDGGTWVFREKDKYKDVIKFGKIEIGDNCFIGANCTILPNVKIGNDCVVGACSLVNKSIPSGEVWAGVPAKFICKTTDYAEKCLENNPKYDRNNYKINKKEELLKIIYENDKK